MDPFAALGELTQSADGKTLTFTDISKYGNNNQGLIITDMVSRQVLIYDAAANLIGTINLTGTNLTGTLNITKDGWYRFMLTFISNEPQTYNGQVNYLATQFYALAQKIYANTITCGCGCSSRGEFYANRSLHALFAANADYTIGDGVDAQTKMDYANVYINEAVL